MTPAGALIAEEIARDGPIPFHRFMEIALYHPEHGYYRKPRDPFGRGGDFFTAAQLQPAFGILMARIVRSLWEELGSPPDFTVVELGPGRGEMREAFSEWRYEPVDVDGGAIPRRFTGVVFANEFFDALPVDVLVSRESGPRERRVDADGSGFRWVEVDVTAPGFTPALPGGLPGPEDGRIFEVNTASLAWLDRIAASLERGFVLAIDYGYTEAEAARFPQGTLMSYRRHRASEDVLAEPGLRDITSHVNFTALERHPAFEPVRFETLAQTLLRAGEPDQFAEVLPHRLQLKTLLFDVGETFRTLLLHRRP
ncbi:MAG: class I SAM-dependent methyltransferase [Bryobacteraceae bacterium]